MPMRAVCLDGRGGDAYAPRGTVAVYEDPHSSARQGHPTQGPRCPGCGNVDPDPLARFCGVCGSAMGAVPAPAASPMAPTAQVPQVPSYGYEVPARLAPPAPPMQPYVAGPLGPGPALQAGVYAVPFVDLVGAGQIGAAVSAVFSLVPCLLLAWGVSSFVSGLRWVLDSLTAASIRVPIPLASVEVPVNYIDLFRLRSFYNSMIYWDDRLWLVFLLVFLVPWVFSIVGGALFGGTLAAIYNMVGKASGGMRVRLVPPQTHPSGPAMQPVAWTGGQLPGPPPGQSPGWPQQGWPSEPRR